MKNLKNILKTLLLAAIIPAVVSSCSKESTGEENGLPYITFGVSGLDVETKSLITDFTSNPVFVYGVRNNTTRIFDNTRITKQNNSSNWVTDHLQQWIPGSSYSFYAYTSSPQSSNNIQDFGITVQNSGLKITVTQPSEYNSNNMVDYMLSHAYKVADGANYHTVMLYMQHAMSYIEIIAQKEMPEHTIAIKDITLENIYRSAIMQCESQANANSGENNVWAIQLQGAKDLSYSTGEITPQNNTTILGSMQIMAIPQQLGNDATLTIEYSVTENNNTKEYSQTFNLFNYTPYVWEPGHKITYTLTINTGVGLKAQISDWTGAGYTEGTILPQ